MASNYDYEQELREYYEQCEDTLAMLKMVEKSRGNKKNKKNKKSYIENPNKRTSTYTKRSRSLILQVNFI